MSPMEKVTEQPMPMPPTPPLQTPPSTIEALTPSLPSSSPSPATGGDDEEHAHGTDLSEATIITISTTPQPLPDSSRFSGSI